MDGLTVRRRAEELDAALARRPGVAVPAPRTELDAELAVVAQLREAGAALHPAPSEEFRTALRSRLLAVAAVQGIGHSPDAAQPATRRPAPPAGHWRQRMTAVAVGLTASAVAVSGVAVAATQSLPGQPFYGVKLTAEDVQLRLADGAREKGVRHLQFAQARLHEVTALAQDAAPSERRTGLLVAALADMDDDTQAGARQLTAAFRTSRDADPLQVLARFAEAQRRGLRALLPVVDGQTDDRVRASLALVSGVSTQAAELLRLVDCTRACDPTAVAPALPAPEPSAPGGPTPCDCPLPGPAPLRLAPPPVPSAEPPTGTPVEEGAVEQPPTGQSPDAPSPTGQSPTGQPPGGGTPAPAPAPGSRSSPLAPDLPALPSPSAPALPLESPLTPLDPLAPVPVPAVPDAPDTPALESPLTPAPLAPVLGGLAALVPSSVVGTVVTPARLAAQWLRGLR